MGDGLSVATVADKGVCLGVVGKALEDVVGEGVGVGFVAWAMSDTRVYKWRCAWGGTSKVG